MTGELKCSCKESSAAQSTSTGSVGNYNEPFKTTGLPSRFLVLPNIFVVICTNITPILPASIMNISFSIVWYLDTDCVHSPTGFFNSLRVYTLPVDAYELPVSSGQSIGPNVTLSRVASRRGDYGHGYPVNHSVARSSYISAPCRAAQAA